MKIDYKKQGKKNRLAGGVFERKVRKDLEAKGWILDRWTNNVELDNEWDGLTEKGYDNPYGGKIHPAKSFMGRTRSNGFPDFVAFKSLEISNKSCNLTYTHNKGLFKVIFIECKIGKYLDKTEKAKAQWYLKNNKCSKFLVAYEVIIGKKKTIEYMEIKLE